jgi:integrase
MNAYPFSIFKRADRPSFLVSFKDENGDYLPPLSTKKKTKEEAQKIAFQWLKEGVQKKQEKTTVQNLSLKNAARKVESEDEAKIIIGELKRSGLVKTFVLNNTEQAEDFISFLKTFWNWEISPYINEKLRRSHGIHKMHCLKQGQGIARYWEPFFTGRFLGDITARDIDAFINHIGKLNISASRKNVVIMAGTKPLRWAFSKGKIEADPTRGHILFSKKPRKRNILTPTAAAALFRTVWDDGRTKLANMLASVTGMRSGEILALRFQDIGADCLYVGGSWNRADKMKLPKNNETRTVEIPFPALLNGLIEVARQNPWGSSPDSFVFWSANKKGSPMRGQRFVGDLRKALMLTGFSKDDAARYDFHSWRHFFTSYMSGKLDKKLLKSQTGHKTDIMLDLYSDHETVGDRELIQAKQRETFAGLLPEQVLLLEYKKNQKTTAA